MDPKKARDAERRRQTKRVEGLETKDILRSAFDMMGKYASLRADSSAEKARGNAGAQVGQPKNSSGQNNTPGKPKGYIQLPKKKDSYIKLPSKSSEQDKKTGSKTTQRKKGGR